MNATHRLTVCITTLVVLLWSGPLYADLELGRVLSLEWLVDSSDEIYLARIIADPALPDGLDVRPERALKSAIFFTEPKSTGGSGTEVYGRELPADSEAVVRFSAQVSGLRRVTRYAQEGDEWLLFIRRVEDEPLEIVRAVNLTRPLEHSRTAAVTSDGEPLPERRRILDAVARRVRLKRSLPEQCRREAVDRGYLSREVVGLYDPAGVGGVLGGFPVAIDCDQWSTPPSDEGLHLVWAVVPADAEFYATLREEADPRTRPARFQDVTKQSVLALVNYPGKETERFLKDLLALPQQDPSKPAARRVLKYFLYHLEPTDPLNGELLGQWRLSGQNELIDLSLEDDNTFAATAYRRPRDDRPEPRRIWTGKGYWVVRDRQLSLHRTHILIGGEWQQNERTIFESKPIREVRPTSVILEAGPPMDRRKGVDEGDEIGE